MDAAEFSEAKADLRERLTKLREELDRYLAGEYGVDPAKTKDYQKWRTTHQPFHWLAEFYGIMHGGGFDVIIGNPPYVVYSPMKVPYTLLAESYRTFDAKNLYAFVYERSMGLAKPHSMIGFIVQLTALSAERLGILQDMLFKRGQSWIVPFPRRPESVFDGVEMPVTIILSAIASQTLTHTSRVQRFYTEERPQAMHAVRLVLHSIRRNGHRVAKLGSPTEIGIYAKLVRPSETLAGLTTSGSRHTLYYQEACRYWLKACVGMPFFKRNGERIDPPHGRTMSFSSKEAVCFAACLANSSLFYWFYSAFSDCEHVNDALLRSFPVPPDWNRSEWPSHYATLAKDLDANATRKIIRTKQGHTIEYNEMKALLSKSIIDTIDYTLSQHYGLSPEETDFLVTYDAKYRCGANADSDDE